MKKLLPFAAWTVLAACTSSGEPARAPDAVAGAKDDKAADGAAAASGGDAAKDEGGADALPTACAETKDKVCLPPAWLARGLCNADFPTVALAMFANGTPWTRAYSVTTSAAWNASGGSSSNEKMTMYEELLILRKRGADNTSGIQVSGAGASFDVLRWDGSCVTLQEGEFVWDRPPKIANARVVFKRLEMHVRDGLKDAPDLSKVYADYRKECKGVTSGDVSLACEKLDGQLSVAIAQYVRDKGGVLPPKKMPKK
jgi:hypothetical protein